VGLEEGKEPSAEDDAPAEADEASKEMRDAALLKALLADSRTEEAALWSTTASEEYELLADPVAVDAAALSELRRELISAFCDERATEAEEMSEPSVNAAYPTADDDTGWKEP
jgi:hypothetical protein